MEWQGVLLDTHILDYLLDAMTDGDHPPHRADPTLREQHVAAFRLFLWGTDLAIGRIAVEEARQAPDENRRRMLEEIINVHLPEVWTQEEDAAVARARTAHFGQYHKGAADCQLVAEAETVDGATTVLTCDVRLIRRLQPHTRIKLKTPVEYWAELAIPRGTRPKWTPHPTNPLLASQFWRWD